jgi:hypothetical protein
VPPAWYAPEAGVIEFELEAPDARNATEEQTR